MSYWKNITTTIKTLTTGLKLTFRHLLKAHRSHKPLPVSSPEYFSQNSGLMTLQYPHESLPVPDNGRYKLHNEIDDCIVCDKCAKICPVDCIDIEPVRATEEIGKTSDGTSKRIYAAKFDIDMAKCCFCGLCTTVCPTECLTMTKSYDFSEYDVADHNYAFATMTPLEILEKKQQLEEQERQKQNEKETAAKTAATRPKMPNQSKPQVPGAKPVLKPKPVMKKPVVKPKPIIPKKKDTDD